MIVKARYLGRLATRIALLLAAGLATSACFAWDANGNFSAFGSGLKSCGSYLSDKAQDYQIADLRYTSWLAGYFTAFNEQTFGVKDILQGTDLDGAIGWISNYCQRNPTDSYERAATKLTEFLRSKIHSEKSSPLSPQPSLLAEVNPQNQSGSPRVTFEPSLFDDLLPKPSVTFDSGSAPVKSDAVEATPIDTTAGPKPAPDPPQQSNGTSAEIVAVKYRGPLSLAPFKCEAVSRSSFVQRVCYDAPNSYMLIDLNGIWYHYCENPLKDPLGPAEEVAWPVVVEVGGGNNHDEREPYGGVFSGR